MSNLTERLRETRRSVIRQRVAAGACWISAACMVAVAAMALVDFYAEVATSWRAVWLVATLTAVVIVGFRAARRAITQYTLSRAAADAESHVSQFGQRLRTTFDYEQIGSEPDARRPAEASPALLTALRNDTSQVARQANWEDVVDVRPAFAAFAVAAFIAFVWCVGLIASAEFRVASGRALLLPLEYTNVSYSPQTTIVKIGEGVEIQAEVVGRPIESAQVRYRPAGSQADWQILDLTSPDEESEDQTAQPHGLAGSLFARFIDLKEDLEFEVVAGPRPLPAGSITVLQPLTLEKTVAHVVPPAYTGKPEETVEGLDLKVLEGSTVELRLELNRPAAAARLARSVTPEKDAAQPASETALLAEAPLVIEGNLIHTTLADLRQAAKYTLTATAADGMQLDSQRLSIRVQLDRRPEIRFLQPPEELVVTPTTEVPMIVEARDDVGLHKVGVMYQVASDEMQTLWEQDAAGSAEPFTAGKVLELEALQVTHKQAITYYAFAEDNYFGAPRRTTTALRYIDIRPFKQAFQVVESEGSCNGCSVTLEELIHRQRLNLSQSFAARELSSADQETLAKLGSAQAELLDKTREFSEGMEQRVGPILTLQAAVLAMEQGVKAFESQQLPEAISAEQDALADLIATRENLRNILKQSNSQSASACRKFDREQRQKLRMPEKKKQQDQQQQVVDVRKKLDDLAKRERQWSKSCQQCSSSSSSKASPSASQQQQQPSDSKSPSPAEVAAAQEKLQAELAELREQMAKLKNASPAAAEQARQADESMRQSLADLKQPDPQSAAKAGERSARQLEQLSEHLAAMNARDFGQRLDQARQLARQLATREEAVEKELGSRPAKNAKSQSQSQGQDAADEDQNSEESPARDQSSPANAKSNRPGTAAGHEQLAREQRALAGDADLLAEQLQVLERDASTERGGIKSKLARAQTENSPRDIAGVMRQTAADLDSRRQAQAARGATQARRQLDELSRTLGDARAEYAQPQLEELIALEEQVAQLKEQMKRAGEKEGVGSAAQRKWEALEPRLDNLAAGDKKLAAALKQLREGPDGKEQPAKGDSASQAAHADGARPPQPGDQLKPANFRPNGGSETPEGHYSWLGLGDAHGLTQVAKVLQARIQEAILAGVLMDSDQPVPPEYRDLVEKYYRALSDDLR